MRAISLPINALILIILAVAVLISTVAFYYPTFIGSEKSISSRSALDRSCILMTNNNCKLNTSKIQTVNFDADKDGIVGESAADGDNLFMLCYNYYQIRCTNQMPGDVDNDCVISSNDFDSFNSVCGPYWGGSPPPDKLFCDCSGDGFISIEDLGCMNSGIIASKTEPGAEMNCKKLCGC